MASERAKARTKRANLASGMAAGAPHGAAPLTPYMAEQRADPKDWRRVRQVTAAEWFGATFAAGSEVGASWLP
jgi:hypothetical protein